MAEDVRTGTSRQPWAPDRPHTVTIGSTWHRDRFPQSRWSVTDLFHYEAGSNGDLLAVTITCLAGPNRGAVKHMSEARLKNRYVQVPA